jgi:hypothetical protein
MTTDIGKYCFVNRFVNYLKEDSIIITRNAIYHSVTLNKEPNTSARKRYPLVGTEK